MGSLWLWALVLTSSSGVRFSNGRLPIVSVSIGDRGPYEFLLDTGSTRTTLCTCLADEIELKLRRPLEVATPAGNVSVLRAKIPALSLGYLSRGPLEVILSDLTVLRRRDRSIRGVLGLDWLSSFHYLIDYDSKRLLIADATDPIAALGTRMIYRREEKLIVVSAEPRLALALDTGAEGLIVEAAAGLAVERDPTDLVRIDSAAGTRILAFGSIDRIRVGAVVLRNVPVTLVPRPIGGGFNGLLPGHFFRRLYVNHPEGYLVLDPR